MVQGSIDLLCFFPDGHIELCDYKTDHITPEERKDISLLQKRMQERHGDQLAQYAAAVEETFGKRPDKAFIFSLPLGDAVEISIP
jgi:ATP-dependent exoDNAse (exonuclease V) beta subunit